MNGHPSESRPRRLSYPPQPLPLPYRRETFLSETALVQKHFQTLRFSLQLVHARPRCRLDLLLLLLSFSSPLRPSPPSSSDSLRALGGLLLWARSDRQSCRTRLRCPPPLCSSSLLGGPQGETKPAVPDILLLLLFRCLGMSEKRAVDLVLQKTLSTLHKKKKKTTEMKKEVVETGRRRLYRLGRFLSLQDLHLYGCFLS